MRNRVCAGYKSFSLLEVIIVVMIVGIIVSFAAPSYRALQERTRDDEAEVHLKFIQAAEKVYRLETGQYINCADNAACSATLNLDLPPDTGNGGAWDYQVQNATAISFDATAVGSKGTSNWTMDQNDEDPQVL